MPGGIARSRRRVAQIAVDAEFTPKAVETRAERVNLVYAAKIDLDGGWNVPLVPGQPAEVSDPAHDRVDSLAIPMICCDQPHADVRQGDGAP